MDLQQLRYFVQVCEAGSFSRAAAVLHLTQPTLSRQVGLLEADLGQRLLERTGRGVRLTDAGQTLLPHARGLLAAAQRARDEMRDLHASPIGRVTVGLPPRVALTLTAPLVQAFRERFPRAVITVQEGLSLHLREWLIAGRLDVALLFDPQASAQLSYETVLRESLLLVCATTQAPLAARVGLRALASYPLVLPSAPNAIRSLVDSALRPRGVALNVVAEVGAVQTVLPLVARGVACTILPESAVALRPADVALQWAAIGPPAIRNTLVLATARARPATRLVRETAALLRTLDFRAHQGAA